jgi:DNA-directed RNA polymerase specialized sigma24 family protein
VTRFHPSGVSLGVDVRQRPDEAEDITQEVFVRTYRELGQYRSDGPLDAWLYRITRRAATQMRRMRRRLGIFGRPSNVFLVKVTYWFAR